MRPFITTQHGALYEADCLDFMRLLRAQTVDCLFADPPFNLGKDYKNGFSDKLSDAAYFRWCRQWIEEGARLLTPGGAFFLYALPELAIRFAAILNEHLKFRHWIALSMKGTYRRGNRLYPAHYALLYYTKGEPRVFNEVRLPIPTCRHCGGEIRDYGGHRDKMNPKGVNLTDFWDDTSPNRHAKFKVRPGVNELKLVIPQRAIEISSEAGDVVFDPFGGGGATFQAAEMLHRNWIGSELYDCAAIKARFAERLPLALRRPSGFDYRELFLENENNRRSLLQRRA
jgi:site-specific DNA-methyltransferase (adenine-specific)